MAAWAFFFSKAGPYPFRDSNYTENYSLLFTILTVAIWIQARREPSSGWLYLTAGILCGLNFLLRPNSIAPQIAITLVELTEGLRLRRLTQNSRRLGLLFLGSALPLGIYSLWSGWRGGFPEFIDAVFVYNLFYSQSGEYGLRAYLLKGITGLAWIPIAMYVALLAQASRRPSEAAGATVAAPFRLYLLVAWPLEALLSSGPGRVYPHHLNTWTPYLGWLTSSVVVFAPSRWRRPIDRFSAGALPLLLLALFVAGNLSTARAYLNLAYRIRDRGARHIEAISPIVRYVTVHSDPGDPVLVWGNEVWINFLSSRPSPTKYAYQYPLFMPGYADAAKVDVFLRGLQQTAPRLIVEPKNADLREVIPLSVLLEQDDLVAQRGLPRELNQVAAYIRENYCVEAVLKEAIVYHAISDTMSQLPCE
jgi:hypothetical protein